MTAKLDEYMYNMKPHATVDRQEQITYKGTYDRPRSTNFARKNT